MRDDARMPTWDDVVTIARALPEVEESTWYRTPALEVRGTPHYDGYGAVLVDLDHVERDQLTELVAEAWRLTAPARLRR